MLPKFQFFGSRHLWHLYVTITDYGTITGNNKTRDSGIVLNNLQQKGIIGTLSTDAIFRVASAHKAIL